MDKARISGSVFPAPVRCFSEILICLEGQAGQQRIATLRDYGQAIDRPWRVPLLVPKWSVSMPRRWSMLT